MSVPNLRHLPTETFPCPYCQSPIAVPANEAMPLSSITCSRCLKPVAPPLDLEFPDKSTHFVELDSSSPQATTPQPHQPVHSQQNIPSPTSFLDPSKRLASAYPPASDLDRNGSSRRDIPQGMTLSPFPSQDRRPGSFKLPHLISLIFALACLAATVALFWQLSLNLSFLGNIDSVQIWLLAACGGSLSAVCFLLALRKPAFPGWILAILSLFGCLALPSQWGWDTANRANRNISTPKKSAPPQPPAALPAPTPAANLHPLPRYEELIGQDRYVIQKARDSAKSPGSTIAALRLYHCPNEYQFEISRFLERVLELPTPPFVLAREKDSLLFIISGTPHSIEQLTALIKPLGTIQHSEPSLNWFCIELAPAAISPLPGDISPDAGIDFYAAQLSELAALDPQRVHQAARKLSHSPISALGTNIHAKLAELLNAPLPNDAAYAADLMAAFSKCSPPDDANSRLLLAKACQQFLDKDRLISNDMLSLAVERYHPALNSVLYHQWKQDIPTWEPRIAKLGASALHLAGQALSDPLVEPALLVSAMRVLSSLNELSRAPDIIAPLKRLSSHPNPQVSQSATTLLDKLSQR